MRNKLSPKDRLWVFADPGLKELIIKCELHLATPITVRNARGGRGDIYSISEKHL